MRSPLRVFFFAARPLLWALSVIVVLSGSGVLVRLRFPSVAVSMSESPTMSGVCAFCQVKEGVSAGKWYVCSDCAGRRVAPKAVCETCVAKRLATSPGTWDPKSSPPFGRRVCATSGSVRFREAATGDYKGLCVPLSAQRDASAACPWMAGIRRAAPGGRRAKRHLPPANSSGPEGVLARGGGVPSEVTSSLSKATQ